MGSVLDFDGISSEKGSFARGAWGEDGLYQLDKGVFGQGACVLSDAFLSIMQYPLLLLNQRKMAVSIALQQVAAGSSCSFW